MTLPARLCRQIQAADPIQRTEESKLSILVILMILGPGCSGYSGYSALDNEPTN
jgi:hypothetical protein